MHYTSFYAAKETNMQHTTIMKIIKRYEKNFAQIGDGTLSDREMISGNRLRKYFFLDTYGYFFLLSLMRNSPEVIIAKENMIKEIKKGLELI